MTLEEIRKAYPIGCRVFDSEARLGSEYIIRGYTKYCSAGDRRDGWYYLNIDRWGGSWPDRWRVVKPLSPLEQDISNYIAAQKRELGLDA